MDQPSIYNQSIFYILSTAQKLIYVYILIGIIALYFLFIILKKYVLPLVKANIDTTIDYNIYRFILFAVLVSGALMAGTFAGKDLSFSKIAYNTAIFNSNLYAQRDPGDPVPYDSKNLGRLDFTDDIYYRYSRSDSKKPKMIQFDSEQSALMNGYLKVGRAEETLKIMGENPNKFKKPSY